MESRYINHASPIAAVSHLSYDSEGRRYYENRLADGKTKPEAISCAQTPNLRPRRDGLEHVTIDIGGQLA